MDIKDYVPVPPTVVEINGKKYIYDFRAIKYKPVIIAMEMGYLRERQIAAIENDPNIDIDLMDVEYQLRLGGTLFVPYVDGKALKFDRSASPEISAQLGEADEPEYEKIEACLVDFFTRRGKRLIASRTLLRNTAGIAVVNGLIKASENLLRSPKPAADSLSAAS